MLNMENAEEVMQILDRFTRLKQKEIPKELDDYMHYVAKTGDTVFKWSSLKYLFREKLLNVIKNFHDTTPRVDDIPQYPNVDPFNYESMKASLLERLELFNAAPFTVQRLCELLTEPRKQYSRIDKFMRALEKNILVSTIEPGRKRSESENGDSLDSVVNGDVSLDVNVDIEMENETIFKAETPSNPTSSATPSSQQSPTLIHKSDDDILPNPKKAKLDLDETTNEAETAVAIKTIADSKKEHVDVADKDEAKQQIPEESKASEEKPTAATNEIVVEAKSDEKISEPEKMEEELPTPSTTENIDLAKKENLEVKSIEEEKTVAVVAEVVEVAKVEPSIPKPEAMSVETVDSSNKTVEIVEEAAKKEETKVEIVEKADIIKEVKEDKAKETDVQNGDVQPNEEETVSSSVTEEKVNSNQSESVSEEITKPSKDEKMENDVKENIENAAKAPIAVSDLKEVTVSESVSSSATEEPTKSDKIKTDDETIAPSEVVSSSVEEVKKASNEIPTELVDKGDSTEPNPPTTESLEKESVAKPEEIKDADPKEEKETECNTEKPTETPIAVDKKEIDTSPPETAPAEKSDAVPLSTETPPAATPTVDAAAIPTETPIIETAEVATAPVTTASVQPSTEVVIPVAVEIPIVTTDQPMEENLESIAEAGPVVPTIVVEAAPAVEEIVMGDSVEMATDAIEPAKDELAGMEVDDTSQEAMDQ